MRIAVCMKSVPADFNKGLDKKAGGILRSPYNSTINPADIFALETAITIKNRYGGSISAITMGPEFAEKQLKEACALGADELFLICDRRAAGADTFATSAVLSAALKSYDLVLCGERSIDGETGQVPAEISARLELPFLNSVNRIVEFKDNTLICKTLDDNEQKEVALPLPAVLAISCGMEDIGHPLAPSLSGLRKVRTVSVRRLNLEDLKISVEQAGEKGSKTMVKQVTIPDWSRKCTMAQSLEIGLSLSMEVLNV